MLKLYTDMDNLPHPILADPHIYFNYFFNWKTMLTDEVIRCIETIEGSKYLFDDIFEGKFGKYTIKDMRYYCYEEVFLSWKELCKVCNITDKDVLFLLDYVRDSIYNNIEYSYVISKGIYSGVIKNLGGNNREKVASSLLGIITNKVGRHISKDEYDLCWINDCCNPFPSNDKRYNHIENNKQVTNCSLRSTLPTFTDKYEMLIRDTILNESLSELLTELDKRYKRKTTKEHNILTVNEQGTNYITQTTHHTAKINIPTKPTIQTHQPTAPRIKGF